MTLKLKLQTLKFFTEKEYMYLFIYLGFYVVFNAVQVISLRVVGRVEETSTHS